MTDFNPTHRTNRAIGHIKADTPIRVARYIDTGFFYLVLGRLGIDSSLTEWFYADQDVMFRDPTERWHTVLPDDYVITDGKNVAVTFTDAGWDLIPDRKINGTEEVNVSFHETYYCLYGVESGRALRLTPNQIRSLMTKLAEAFTDASMLKDARYISARTVDLGEYRTLAKIDGVWYDHNGDEYTDDEVLVSYEGIEVIR